MFFYAQNLTGITSTLLEAHRLFYHIQFMCTPITARAEAMDWLEKQGAPGYISLREEANSFVSEERAQIFTAAVAHAIASRFHRCG